MEQFAAMLPDEQKAMLMKMGEQMKKFFSGEIKFKSQKYKGYNFIPGFDPETVKAADEHLECYQNAIYVSSFPKTGTNWTLEIVRQMLYGDDPKMNAMTKAIPLPFIAVEMGMAAKFQIMQHMPLPRRYFGTHLPTELLDIEKIKKNKGKIIYIMRNPKDQAVSWFHFTQAPIFDATRDVISRDWDQFFSNYTQGKQPIMSKDGEWYFEHILDWYRFKDDKDFLFLHFEDVKKDPKKELARIAKFLDIKMSDKRIAEVAEGTAFEAMKKASVEAPSEMAKLTNKANMMRKGNVGTWKEKFTDAQSELMDKLVEEKLGQTDIQFTYEL